MAKQLHKVASSALRHLSSALDSFIRDGKEPLDCTAVHPESYDAARKIPGNYGIQTF